MKFAEKKAAVFFSRRSTPWIPKAAITTVKAAANFIARFIGKGIGGARMSKEKMLP